MGEGHSMAPRTGLSRLILILVVGTIAVFLATCGGDEPTPAAIPGERIAPPTVDISTPSPTPTAIAPTPTPVPTLVPFRPTATPSPTPTPVPTPIPQELIDEIEAQLPTPRMNHEGLLLADGRVLFVGGTLPTVANNGVIIGGPNSFLEIYDPAAEEWSLVLPIDLGLVGVDSVSLSDGTVLLFSLRKPEYESSFFWPLRIAGEDDSPLPLYTVFRLDTEEKMLSEVSTAAIPRFGPSLIAMDDGRVMVVGGTALEIEEGSFGLPMVTAVEIYDPAANTWEIAAPLSGDLLESLVASDEGPHLVWVGHYQGGAAVVLVGEPEDSDPQGVIMLYDPSADAWETVTEFGFEYISSAPQVRVISGGTFSFFYDGDSFDNSSGRIEMFDPASGEWSFAIVPQSVPLSASVTELPDGRLFIAGGDRSEDSGLPGTGTSVYDPSTGVWAVGPDLTEARSNHSATALPDGSVLLFSGVTIWEENESEGVPTNSMEIISAAKIAAVDTVTPPEGGFIGATTWEACIGATDIELPALSTEGTEGEVETTLAAAEIIRQSVKAMAELESYALDLVISSRQVNQSFHLSYATDSRCGYGESAFAAPDQLAIHSFEVYEGQVYTVGEAITIGETTYWRQNEEDLWEAGDTFHPIAPHAQFLNSEIEAYFDSSRVLTILNVDGVEVFQITGVRTRYPGSIENITFWIGVEDMLLRGMYISEREPEAVGSSSEGDAAIVYHSFNEDFNIQPPPESEIAEPEE